MKKYYTHKVGVFNLDQLRQGLDSVAIEEAKKETNLPYVNSKRKKILGVLHMEVWLGSDFKI